MHKVKLIVLLVSCFLNVVQSSLIDNNCNCIDVGEFCNYDLPNFRECGFGDRNYEHAIYVCVAKGKKPEKRDACGAELCCTYVNEKTAGMYVVCERQNNCFSNNRACWIGDWSREEKKCHKK